MDVNEIITAAEAGNVTCYLSGCICDECGTSRYDIDIFTAPVETHKPEGDPIW